MQTRKRIEEILKEELEKSRVRYQESKKDFAEAARDAKGVGNADGHFSARQAVVRESQARQAYVTALLRFNRFLLDGTVPDDLPSENSPQPAPPE